MRPAETPSRLSLGVGIGIGIGIETGRGLDTDADPDTDLTGSKARNSPTARGDTRPRPVGGSILTCHPEVTHQNRAVMNAPKAVMALLLLAAAAGCSTKTTVTVANESNVTISNVTVTATGFKQSIDMLPAGEARSYEFELQGDSGLKVIYEAGGRKIDTGSQGYLMAKQRHVVQLSIRTNDSVGLKIGRSRF